jgi:hypothetical protein
MCKTPCFYYLSTIAVSFKKHCSVNVHYCEGRHTVAEVLGGAPEPFPFHVIRPGFINTY